MVIKRLKNKEYYKDMHNYNSYDCVIKFIVSKNDDVYWEEKIIIYESCYDSAKDLLFKYIKNNENLDNIQIEDVEIIEDISLIKKSVGYKKQINGNISNMSNNLLGYDKNNMNLNKDDVINTLINNKKDE